jgi:hypothetical protein
MMMEFTGKAINGYRILEPVACDGISTLYKAASPNGGKLVGIKIFPSELSRNRQILERMRTSFQAVSRINHPGILPVMSFNVIEGYPYIVIPFIAAGSLEDRIAFGALAAINTEVVIKGAASALGKAHSRGLVHGNLNPSQILFDENGKVQIIGIGEESFMRVFSQDIETIQTTSFDYRAPEVKSRAEITPSSDQYSLALIALQLLTRLPVDQALRGLEFHLENGKEFRTRPNNLAIALPSKVIDVLARALSVNPSDRFPSMKAMFQALEGTIWKETPSADSRPVQSDTRPVQKKAEPKKQSRNRILIFAVAMLIVLCLFAIEPALSLRGDFKLGNLLSTIGLSKSGQVAGVDSVRGGTIEPVKVATLVPDEGVIVVGDIDIQLTSDSTTEGTEETETESPGTSTPPISPSATFTPMPTQVVQKTPTAISTATFTEPAATMTSTATATSTSQWCSSDPGSDHYCTPTPIPTIDPDRCSSYHGSDRYCTPTPTATRSSQWCSRDPHSDHYCTPTPEPTIDPDVCSRDYHDDNFCTRTPTP